MTNSSKYEIKSMEYEDMYHTLTETNMRHVVPTYQRGYSWTKKTIDDFLKDVTGVIHENRPHFFGTMFTVNKNRSELRLVDGQQRFTTTILLLIAIRDYLHRYHKDMDMQFINKCIYQTNNSTSKITKKCMIELGYSDNNFFQKYIAELEKMDDSIKIKKNNFTNSQKLLIRSYIHLTKFVKKSFLDKNDINFTPTCIEKTVNTLLEMLKVITLDLKHEEDAYDMFQLINTRGEKLDDGDLVKSKIFAMLSEKNIRNKENRENEWIEMWKEIDNNVTKHSQYKMEDFLQDYIVAFKHNSFISTSQDLSSEKLQPKNLYDNFKKLIKMEENTPEKILKELDKYSEILNILRNPEDRFSEHRETMHYLKLIKMTRASYVYVVLLIAYEKWWKRRKKDDFRKIVKICFKYHARIKYFRNVSNHAYGARVYDVAEMIIDGKRTNEIVKMLKEDSLYPDHDLALNQIKKHIPDVTSAKILLIEIERKRNNNKELRDDTTIEHILAKDEGKGISYIKEYNRDKSDLELKKLHKDNCGLLGNLALMPNEENRAQSNNPFKDKKKAYKDVEYFTTSELSNKRKWTINMIQSRQKEFTSKLVELFDL